MPFDIFAEFAGQPLWLRAAFLSFVGLVLWLDLGVVNNHEGVISPRRSAVIWGAFVADGEEGSSSHAARMRLVAPRANP